MRAQTLATFRRALAEHHGGPFQAPGVSHRALWRLQALFTSRSYDEVLSDKIRHVLETLRPGNIFIWHGDGDFTHEDTMRGIKLMGEHVLPAVREIGEELELKSAFEIDPATNQPFPAASAPAPAGAGR